MMIAAEEMGFKIKLNKDKSNERLREDSLNDSNLEEDEDYWDSTESEDNVSNGEWESIEEEEAEAWETEMNRLTRKEQLKIILNKLREHKRQGGKDGIDEKIQEIERELRRCL